MWVRSQVGTHRREVLYCCEDTSGHCVRHRLRVSHWYLMNSVLSWQGRGGIHRVFWAETYRKHASMAIPSKSVRASSWSLKRSDDREGGRGFRAIHF